jgi:hypothetical protein
LKLLDKSIDKLSRRIERIDPSVSNNNGSGTRYWKGKKIIPLEKWEEIAFANADAGGYRLMQTEEALEYFPDDYSASFQGWFKENANKWYSDYIKLMEYTKNPTYGNRKCFDCLLSGGREDPIFIGIDRLVVKGLDLIQQDTTNNNIQYPCPVVNRFKCPYEKDKQVSKNKDTDFDVNDLFELEKMAFAVEIAFAKTENHTSKIHLKNKQELYHALTDRETFSSILEQSFDNNKE